ncbi:S41 family peptidase [Shewanella sp.]|uniref:S41 family peptidase n=1 Tax=Shewanella sp. TaxID=50422 RepID=UPI003A985D40
MRLSSPLLLLTSVLLSTTVTADPRSDCVQDLQSIPDFLLKNDTGATAHLAQKGQAYFDAALSTALADANKIDDLTQCQAVIQSYLRAWRHGHLAIVAVKQPTEQQTAATTDKPKEPQANPNEPVFKQLCEHTALLRIASFGPRYKQPLEMLLKQHHDQLANSDYWIIDIRENGGGADSTYAPLLPWIMADGWQEIGTEWLVTPSNIQAQQAICERYMPGDQSCVQQMEPIIKAMQSAPVGSYVQGEDAAISFQTVDKLEPKRPQKIVVLTGRKCGSSCEQFLLTVRQSFNVKLVGQRSYGSLDYSNLRPHLLPSQQFEVYYATSRSLRLPEMPVDIQGVIPDIYLAQPKDAQQAQAQLEHVLG